MPGTGNLCRLLRSRPRLPDFQIEINFSRAINTKEIFTALLGTTSTGRSQVDGYPINEQLNVALDRLIEDLTTKRVKENEENGNNSLQGGCG